MKAVAAEVDVKKAHPSKKTMKPDPNTTLPELDSKDSEKEHKTKCHGFAHHSDTNFSMWQDEQISQGLKQSDKQRHSRNSKTTRGNQRYG